ncbi:SGNH/GDSL hydrolase family protein [Streptomyces sp. 4N509B]|uniref:SGNH/GDSL hydrolase family protein n=1 Tax=Streptomyces sp. 4N509B TaxID=3457413 RepID=UPI003FD4B493
MRRSRASLTRLTHVAATGALALALGVTLLAGNSGGAHGEARGEAAAAAHGRPSQSGQHWVHSWTAMPQLTEPHNMPPPPFTGSDAVLVDTTLRQTVHVSTGGERIRLRFSNAFGDTPLPLTSVLVALPAGGQAGVSAIEPGSSRAVTFNGERSITVPVGAQVVSDPITFDLDDASNLTVTTYLADGQPSLNLTSHPGSRTTSHLLAGEHTDAQNLAGATPSDHWYLLSGVEVWSSRQTAALAILGDSLTDGRGSTTNGNNRWPDQLLTRLQDEDATENVAVLNQAAGGNRVLNDGLGPNVLARMDRDVLAHSGVDWLILFEGVNDIGTAEATEAAQRQVAQDLITAFDQIITRAHAHDIKVYGATLLPFGGADYDDPGGYREQARTTVNEWIRTSGRFDEVLDFDAAVRDPAQPDQLLPTLHDGDWLHLNPQGYGELAAAVPTDLFVTGRHHRR